MRRVAALAAAGLLAAQAPAPPTAPAPATPSVPSAPATPATPGQGLSAPDSWVVKGTAELVLLDRLRGQPSQVSVKVGEQAVFGSLTIAVRGCDARPPDLPQNAAAFLDITDGKGSAPPFHGWVLSTTPSVSLYEHPVYDLRLVTCR